MRSKQKLFQLNLVFILTSFCITAIWGFVPACRTNGWAQTEFTTKPKTTAQRIRSAPTGYSRHTNGYFYPNVVNPNHPTQQNHAVEPVGPSPAQFSSVPPPENRPEPRGEGVAKPAAPGQAVKGRAKFAHPGIAPKVKAQVPQKLQAFVPVKVAPAKYLSPAHSVFHANLDMLTVPEHDRKYLFYFSAYNFPKEHRRQVWQTLTFAVNSLSTKRVLKRPVIVANTGDSLFRVDIRWFGWSRKTLENLVYKGSGPSPLPEPYFYMTFVEATSSHTKKVPYETTEKYQYQQGGYWYTGTRKVTKYKEVKVQPEQREFQALAPWLDPAVVQSLTSNLHTKAPIARADFFICYGLQGPAYYDLLGVAERTEAELQKLALFDLDNSTKVELRGTADSRVVTLNNRILVRVPTISGVRGGYWWESNDYETSVDADDVHNNLFATPDAKEFIFTLRNGLQGYGLADKAGKLLDVAGAQFAQDTETKFHDKRVFTGRSCIACHQQGLRAFSNRVKQLSRGTIALLVAKEKDAKKVEERYFSYDIEALVRHDQSLYATAVTGCNGLTPAGNAAQFDLLQYNYLEEKLTLPQVAYEMGVPADQLKTLLQKGVNLDHTLVGLLQTPPLSIRREQFERRSFTQAALLLMQAGAYTEGAPKKKQGD